ncbi:MAG TPA: cation-transporting P-type ATPase [Stellaceae bacterium]|nr:cation-transporting P-type ATPase [Stellaceae bacterium]
MDQILAAAPELQSKRPVGLSKAQAQSRLAQYGLNEIPERHPHPALALLRKFWGPIPWMLEPTSAWVIPTDENLMVARQTRRLLDRRRI